MLRKLFNIVLFGIAFLIMCYVLDLTGMNTIGTRNLLGSIDGLGITFIHYHTDKIYDILASDKVSEIASIASASSLPSA